VKFLRCSSIEVGDHLNRSLQRLIAAHREKLSHIRAIYFDPYNECDNERHEFDGLSYMVRPLTQGNEQKPQLSLPIAYEEEGDDFAECEFFSFVAWDHVSWPGNDFYIGSRATDDGVKGAATDVTRVMTNLNGFYDSYQNKYLPPIGFKNWASLIYQYGIEIDINQTNLQII